MTQRFTDNRTSPVPPHVIRGADKAYLEGGKWRCPGRIAHHVVYNAKGVGVCKDCGRKR